MRFRTFEGGGSWSVFLRDFEGGVVDEVIPRWGGVVGAFS